MTDEKKADPQASQEKNLISGNVNTGSDLLARFLDAVKNPSERLRVDVKEYRGNTYIDIRVWYVTDDGDYRPSSKGVMFKPTLAAELMRGLALAARSFDPKGVN
ncbi:transcriptional coactivator p15/PC4 family protein [Paraburkholderia tropica]|uniref:transcriptional coactivator p15/PC4 family protein n=1 Tax=Paraburkholderia tropica TaxID=92647 RepID=UPI002AB176E6|nr:transcriptional coactivator p15/PC4 family protein [Paraburkholderia tropica]